MEPTTAAAATAPEGGKLVGVHEPNKKAWSGGGGAAESVNVVLGRERTPDNDNDNSKEEKNGNPNNKTSNNATAPPVQNPKSHAKPAVTYASMLMAGKTTVSTPKPEPKPPSPPQLSVPSTDTPTSATVEPPQPNNNENKPVDEHVDISSNEDETEKSDQMNVEGTAATELDVTTTSVAVTSNNDEQPPTDTTKTSSKLTASETAAAAQPQEEEYPLTSTSPSPSSSNNIKPVIVPPAASADNDPVDSALLAALRDPRERLGLLKLEQVMVDFIEKQPQDPFVDIGGPYNSSIISPSIGIISPSAFAVRNPSSNNNSTGGVSSSSGSSSPIFNEVAYQNLLTNGSRVQTTFHKCLIHRLGDRFQMVRERAYNAEGTYYNNQYIRLCKTATTRIPPRRLVDIPQEEYYAVEALQSSMKQMSVSSSVGRLSRTADMPTDVVGDRGSNITPGSGGGITGTGSSGTNPVPSHSGPPPTLGNATGTATYNPQPRSSFSSSKNRKMVIMKRSSSNVSDGSSSGGIGSSVTSKSKARSDSKKDSLSEKEKKYAEARARIFQQDQNDSDVVETAAVDVSLDVSQESTDAISQSGGVSKPFTKATYRNKQQEESDPDFRRGIGVVSKKPGDNQTSLVGANPTPTSSTPAAAVAEQTNPPSAPAPSGAQMVNPYTPGSGYIVTPPTSTTASTSRTSNTVEHTTAVPAAYPSPMYYYQTPQGGYYAYNPAAYDPNAYATAATGGGIGGPGFVTPHPVYPGYGVQQNQHWQQPYQYDASKRNTKNTRASSSSSSGSGRKGGKNGGNEKSTLNNAQQVVKTETALKP